MDLKDIPSEVKLLLPGALGSLFSMLMNKDSVIRSIFTFFGGVAFAFYATPYTVKITDFDPGLAGFLLGFFGMAIISSFFDGWRKVDLSTIFRDAFRQILRLPKVEK